MRDTFQIFAAYLLTLSLCVTSLCGPAQASEGEIEKPPAASNGSASGSWNPPRPSASSERIDERKAMVDRQIAYPLYGRDPVTDAKVLEAMATVPRHVFVPPDRRATAYSDSPLPIGHGQTISQPYIVAYMTELLALEPGDKVLEVGTGSGYQAAVLAQLTSEVYTIEIIEPLAERAAATLAAQGYESIKTKRADGYFGWKEHAPFDAIIVTAAAGHVPPPLWSQLRPGGRMAIPVGGTYEVQRLLMLAKTKEGERESRSVMAVRFVPLTRE